jgi:hypothetical protein
MSWGCLSAVRSVWVVGGEQYVAAAVTVFDARGVGSRAAHSSLRRVVSFGHDLTQPLMIWAWLGGVRDG